MKMFDSPVSVLQNAHDLSDEELIALLQADEFDKELFASADEARKSVYGDEVYMRGLKSQRIATRLILMQVLIAIFYAMKRRTMCITKSSIPIR